jgi:hypothetical protein
LAGVVAHAGGRHHGCGADPRSRRPKCRAGAGGGLLAIAPLLLAFFVGSALLAHGFARAGVASRASVWLIAGALALAVIGGRLAAGNAAAARGIGLGVLGLVSVSQAWLGAALWRRPSGESAAAAAGHSSN